jgi:ABC-type nitrate/sulfonate/bicarbonate transport system substrate-binding protein
MSLIGWVGAALLVSTANLLLAAEVGAPERIRILYASTATSFAPIWIASDLRIYKKHRLDAEAGDFSCSNSENHST